MELLVDSSSLIIKKKKKARGEKKIEKRLNEQRMKEN
jgi:hypothetical protein